MYDHYLSNFDDFCIIIPSPYFSTEFTKLNAVPIMTHCVFCSLSSPIQKLIINVNVLCSEKLDQLMIGQLFQ